MLLIHLLSNLHILIISSLSVLAAPKLDMLDREISLAVVRTFDQLCLLLMSRLTQMGWHKWFVSSGCLCWHKRKMSVSQFVYVLTQTEKFVSTQTICIAARTMAPATSPIAGTWTVTTTTGANGNRNSRKLRRPLKSIVSFWYRSPDVEFPKVNRW